MSVQAVSTNEACRPFFFFKKHLLGFPVDYSVHSRVNRNKGVIKRDNLDKQPTMLGRFFFHFIISRLAYFNRRFLCYSSSSEFKINLTLVKTNSSVKIIAFVPC